MRAKAIAAFESSEAARKVQDRLRDFGIPVQMQSQAAGAGRWPALAPNRLFKLVVPSFCARDVEEFMRRMDEGDGLLEEAIRCPKCGSFRIESRQITRRALMPGMSWLHHLGWFREGLYCCDCYRTWGLQPPPPDPVRPLAQA